jgi:cytidylate kinase
MSIRITITGDLGSGKSTICSILSKMTGVEAFSTGKVQRRIAEKYGMSTTELNIYMETHPELDHEIDDELTRLAAEQQDVIIDSRLAWHFAADTFKVQAIVDATIAAERIMGDDRGKAESYASLDDAIRQLVERTASENYRYQQLYGVNCQDEGNFDFIVDTSLASPDEAARAIMSAREDWAGGTPFAKLMLSPRKLLEPLDASALDEARVEEYAASIAAGEKLLGIVVKSQKDCFRVVEGSHRYAAYLKCGTALIPCDLRKQGS